MSQKGNDATDALINEYTKALYQNETQAILTHWRQICNQQNFSETQHQAGILWIGHRLELYTNNTPLSATNIALKLLQDECAISQVRFLQFSEEQELPESAIMTISSSQKLLRAADLKKNQIYIDSYGFMFQYPHELIAAQRSPLKMGNATIIEVPEATYQYINHFRFFITNIIKHPACLDISLDILANKDHQNLLANINDRWVLSESGPILIPFLLNNTVFSTLRQYDPSDVLSKNHLLQNLLDCSTLSEKQKIEICMHAYEKMHKTTVQKYLLTKKTTWQSVSAIRISSAADVKAHKQHLLSTQASHQRLLTDFQQQIQTYCQSHLKILNGTYIANSNTHPNRADAVTTLVNNMHTDTLKIETLLQDPELRKKAGEDDTHLSLRTSLWSRCKQFLEKLTCLKQWQQTPISDSELITMMLDLTVYRQLDQGSWDDLFYASNPILFYKIVNEFYQGATPTGVEPLQQQAFLLTELNDYNQIRCKRGLPTFLLPGYIRSGDIAQIGNREAENLYQLDELTILNGEHLIRQAHNQTLINTVPSDATKTRHPRYDFYFMPILEHIICTNNQNSPFIQRHHAYQSYLNKLLQQHTLQTHSRPIIYCGLVNIDNNHYCSVFIYKEPTIQATTRAHIILFNPSAPHTALPNDTKANTTIKLARFYQQLLPQASVQQADYVSILRERDCGFCALDMIDSVLATANTDKPILLYDQQQKKWALHLENYSNYHQTPTYICPQSKQFIYNKSIDDYSLAIREKWARKLRQLTSTSCYEVIPTNPQWPESYKQTELCAYDYQQLVMCQFEDDTLQQAISNLQARMLSVAADVITTIERHITQRLLPPTREQLASIEHKLYAACQNDVERSELDALADLQSGKLSRLLLKAVTSYFYEHIKNILTLQYHDFIKAQRLNMETDAHNLLQTYLHMQSAQMLYSWFSPLQRIQLQRDLQQIGREQLQQLRIRYHLVTIEQVLNNKNHLWHIGNEQIKRRHINARMLITSLQTDPSFVETDLQQRLAIITATEVQALNANAACQELITTRANAHIDSLTAAVQMLVKSNIETLRAQSLGRLFLLNSQQPSINHFIASCKQHEMLDRVSSHPNSPLTKKLTALFISEHKQVMKQLFANAYEARIQTWCNTYFSDPKHKADLHSRVLALNIADRLDLISTDHCFSALLEHLQTSEQLPASVIHQYKFHFHSHYCQYLATIRLQHMQQAAAGMIDYCALPRYYHYQQLISLCLDDADLTQLTPHLIKYAPQDGLIFSFLSNSKNLARLSPRTRTALSNAIKDSIGHLFASKYTQLSQLSRLVHSTFTYLTAQQQSFMTGPKHGLCTTTLYKAFIEAKLACSHLQHQLANCPLQSASLFNQTVQKITKQYQVCIEKLLKVLLQPSFSSEILADIYLAECMPILQTLTQKPIDLCQLDGQSSRERLKQLHINCAQCLNVDHMLRAEYITDSQPTPLEVARAALTPTRNTIDNTAPAFTATRLHQLLALHHTPQNIRLYDITVFCPPPPSKTLTASLWQRLKDCAIDNPEKQCLLDLSSLLDRHLRDPNSMLSVDQLLLITEILRLRWQKRQALGTTATAYLQSEDKVDKLFFLIANLTAIALRSYHISAYTYHLIVPNHDVYPAVTHLATPYFPQCIIDITDPGADRTSYTVDDIPLSHLLFLPDRYAVNVTWLIESLNTCFNQAKQNTRLTIEQPYTGRELTEADMQHIEKHFPHCFAKLQAKLMEYSLSQSVSTRSIDLLQDFINGSIFSQGFTDYYSERQNRKADTAQQRFLSKLMKLPEAEQNALLRCPIPHSKNGETVASNFDQSVKKFFLDGRSKKQKQEVKCVALQSYYTAAVIYAFKPHLMQLATSQLSRENVERYLSKKIPDWSTKTKTLSPALKRLIPKQQETSMLKSLQQTFRGRLSL